MNTWIHTLACRTLVLVALVLAVAGAHGAARAQSPESTRAQDPSTSAQDPSSSTQGPSTNVEGLSSSGPSKLWVVIGGGHNTLKGDCTFCEEEGRPPRYSNNYSLLADVGTRLNNQTDIGIELVWAPSTTEEGVDARTTFIVGLVQFRPWGSSGFFVKGGMGMAFVRNWRFEDSPVTQKALAVAIGGGWAFRPDDRFGFQLYAAQHAAALGDFATNEVTYENVMGNYWSVGAALVFR